MRKVDAGNFPRNALTRRLKRLCEKSVAQPLGGRELVRAVYKGGVPQTSTQAGEPVAVCRKTWRLVENQAPGDVIGKRVLQRGTKP